MTNLLVAFSTAFLTSLLLTPVVRAFARSIGLIARPSKDRWHEQPTALLGGIAIYGGFVVGVLALFVLLSEGSIRSLGMLPRSGLGIILSSTFMFVTGLADDKFKLRPSAKLILQGVAAATLVSFGVLYPVTPWPTLNILITMFWFLALTNALNLLDNMDGVAVGVGGVAAFFLAVTFAGEGAWFLASVCMVLGGAAFGFLPYNFNRASIFMGDSGSLFIGSLLAGLGAAYPSTAPGSIVSVLFVPALIVIIPILDTLLVSVTRTLAGRSVSIGGRDHTTHRLVAMGLSEPQTALLLYAFAASGGMLAMILRHSDLVLGLWIGAIFLVALLILAAYLGRMHTYSPGEGNPAGRVTILVSDLLYKRRALEVILDLVLFGVAYYGAYLLRYDGRLLPAHAVLLEQTSALAIASKSVAFGAVGVYRGVWQHVTIADVHRLMKGIFVGTLLTVAVLVFFFREADFSRSILVLDAILVVLLTTGARLSFRSLERLQNKLNPGGTRTLIYGAGKGGELLVRELLGNAKRLDLRPVGFLDDDPHKRGRVLCGLPVLGSVEDLAPMVARERIQTVVIGTNKLQAGTLEYLLRSCEPLGVELLQLELRLRKVRGVVPPSPVRERHEQEASAPGRVRV